VTSIPVDDLLAGQALFDLSAEESRELEELLAREPGLDSGSFELAAAAASLALLPPAPEAMPDDLERRVLEQARGFLAAREPARPAAARPDARVLALPGRTVPHPAETPSRSGRQTGWLAAAACLALAVAGWWPRLTAPPAAPPSPPVPVAERPAPNHPEQVLAHAPDRVAIPWQHTEDPAARTAGGEVVWSTGLQRGYMRFHGLPANDPVRRQYQLWIFDASQDERYPIDGGVFDVPAGQTEVVVPIAPNLRVTRPTLFAITEEKAGGVVVSSREHLLLVAPSA
jgi:hypothetical protein